MSFGAGILIGCVLGACLGVVVAGLLYCSKDHGAHDLGDE